jgi:capsular polysaccharide biosynthesis protein
LAQIAAAALEVLQQDSAAYFPQLGETPSVTILDDIQITAAPPPIASRVEPILLMGVAGLGGLALAILAATLDRTLYNRDDVERLGLRVIASVPRD